MLPKMNPLYSKEMKTEDIGEIYKHDMIRQLLTYYLLSQGLQLNMN